MVWATLLLLLQILNVGLETITPALPILKMQPRGMARRIAAAPGAGKTRLVGRLLIPFDILSNLPVIALDPNGALSSEVLDTIDRLPGFLRKLIQPRIIYINMAGQCIGNHVYVFGFPFLYTSEKGSESFYTKAHRFLTVLSATDPEQARAPVMGRTAIEAIGENVLMVLAAMHWQITEASLLLANPRHYQEQLMQAKNKYPEVGPAVDYLLGEYAALRPRDQDMKAGQFLRKVSPFRLDPTLRAIFGASQPTLPVERIVTQRLCVLLDFKDVPKSQRPLMICWVYKYFDEYFRERGPGKVKS